MVYVYYNLRLLVRQIQKTPDVDAISLDEIDTSAEWRVESERPVIARFVGKVQELESGLETGVTGASPPTVTSMGGSFYLGGQVQGRRP
jgi:hypothetical protein